MKIAVCFVGHVRTAEYTIENFRRYFGDLFKNCDFFIHTWIENDYKKRYGRSAKIQEICDQRGLDYESFRSLGPEVLRPSLTPSSTLSVLDKINDAYQFKSIIVERFDAKNHYDLNHGIAPFFYSWYQTAQAKKFYEEKYKFKYDLVVRTRLDLVFAPEDNFQREIDNMKDLNSLYAQGCRPAHKSVNEIFSFGTSDVMDTYADYFTKVKRGPTPLKTPGEYIYESGLTLSKMLMNFFAIYRPETIPTDSLNFGKCYNIDNDWYWSASNKLRFPE